jgi:hypothetical protein
MSFGSFLVGSFHVFFFGCLEAPFPWPISPLIL